MPSRTPRNGAKNGDLSSWGPSPAAGWLPAEGGTRPSVSFLHALSTPPLPLVPALPTAEGRCPGRAFGPGPPPPSLCLSEETGACPWHPASPSPPQKVPTVCLSFEVLRHHALKNNSSPGIPSHNPHPSPLGKPPLIAEAADLGELGR